MEREDEAAIAQVEADIEACEALLRGAAPPQRASGALQLLAGAGGARREAEEAAIKAAGAEAAGDGVAACARRQGPLPRDAVARGFCGHRDRHARRDGVGGPPP